MDIRELLGSLELDKLVDEAREGLIEDAEQAGKSWWSEHRDTTAELGKEAVEAFTMMLVLERMPDTAIDPGLNIKKMQAAAKLSELSAEHQEKLNALRDALTKRVAIVLRNAADRIIAIAAKAALLAMA